MILWWERLSLESSLTLEEASLGGGSTVGRFGTVNGTIIIHFMCSGGFVNTSLIVLNVSLLYYIDLLPSVKSTVNEAGHAVLEYMTLLGILPNILLLTLIDTII